MNQLPQIRTYGEYKGNGNYGAHCLMVNIGALALYFSYETIVAFSTSYAGLKVRKNDWSATTGKHLNWIDGGEKENRLDSEVFEQALKTALGSYGLTQ